MTRQRSNALAGPTDPRYQRGLLKIQMMNAKPVHERLQAFLRKIFGSDLLANADKYAKHDSTLTLTLADAIYTLYSGSEDQPSQETIAEEKFTNDLLDAVPREVYKKYIVQGNASSGFHYFSISTGKPTFRVYLNPKVERAIAIVKKLVAFFRAKPGDVVAFKVTGPRKLGSRRDGIVIYCGSRATALATAEEMNKAPTDYNDAVPALTDKIGIGIAIGAEPAQQGTGLGWKTQEEGIRREKGQSFGSIRCELIAMAIYNFNDNKHIIGDSFETFMELVSVAFTAYGLDPTKPAD